MSIRSAYTAILEKRAAEEVIDNAADGMAELSRTRSDSRKTLGDMFDGADTFGSEMTKDVKKLFPGSSAKEGGHAFMKLARASFYHGGLLKTASPSYKEVMCRSFATELEKING